MKAGILKQFIIISLLFTSGIAIGLLSNPALITVGQKQEQPVKSAPVKKVSRKKQRYA